jgi:hypothetical protein
VALGEGAKLRAFLVRDPCRVELLDHALGAQDAQGGVARADELARHIDQALQDLGGRMDGGDGQRRLVQCLQPHTQPLLRRIAAREIDVLLGTDDSHGHWKRDDRVAIVLDGDVPDGAFVDELLDACSQVAAGDCFRSCHDRSS